LALPSTLSKLSAGLIDPGGVSLRLLQSQNGHIDILWFCLENGSQAGETGG